MNLVNNDEKLTVINPDGTIKIWLKDLFEKDGSEYYLIANYEVGMEREDLDSIVMQGGCCLIDLYEIVQLDREEQSLLFKFKETIKT